MKNFILLLSVLALTPYSSLAGKIQKQGIKTAAECVSAGATAATCLPEDTQIYVTASGLNKSLYQAIVDNDLSGGGGGSDYTPNAQTGTTYTFALTDRISQGGYVTLSNASPVTATVPPNSSVAFPVGSRIEVDQKGAGAVTIAEGSGVTVNSIGGVKLLKTQYAHVSLVKLATDLWHLFGDLSDGFISATGGTITTDGNYKVHTFNSSGTFTITSGYGAVDSLVVAGGGGGCSGNGGGGGAGGLVYTTGQIKAPGAFTVTVGSGGSSCNTGSNSVFDSITADGGGAGGGGGSNGGNGGSGGGSGSGSGLAGGTATSGQGFDGGDTLGTNQSPGFPGAGGGGCSAAGGDRTSASNTAGSGANGCANSITGSSVTYAGGGGGGTSTGGTAGGGGTGGGGAGCNTNACTATAGTANLGGGGGGASGTGGAGGMGVVVIRYKFQ